MLLTKLVLLHSSPIFATRIIFRALSGEVVAEGEMDVIAPEHSSPELALINTLSKAPVHTEWQIMQASGVEDEFQAVLVPRVNVEKIIDRWIGTTGNDYLRARTRSSLLGFQPLVHPGKELIRWIFQQIEKSFQLDPVPCCVSGDSVPALGYSIEYQAPDWFTYNEGSLDVHVVPGLFLLRRCGRGKMELNTNQGAVPQIIFETVGFEQDGLQPHGMVRNHPYRFNAPGTDQEVRNHVQFLLGTD